MLRFIISELMGLNVLLVIFSRWVALFQIEKPSADDKIALQFDATLLIFICFESVRHELSVLKI